MNVLKSTMVKLPEFVLDFWKNKDEDFQKRVSESVVLDMVRKHEISAGKGAELLGMNRWDFWQLMSENNVPHVDMTENELDDSLNVGRSLAS